MDVDNNQESMLKTFIDEEDDIGVLRREKLRGLVLAATDLDRTFLEDQRLEVPKSTLTWKERSDRKRSNWREQISKMTAISTSIPIHKNTFTVLQGIHDDGDEQGDCLLLISDDDMSIDEEVDDGKW